MPRESGASSKRRHREGCWQHRILDHPLSRV